MVEDTWLDGEYTCRITFSTRHADGTEKVPDTRKEGE